MASTEQPAFYTRTDQLLRLPLTFAMNPKPTHALNASALKNGYLAINLDIWSVTKAFDNEHEGIFGINKPKLSN